MFEYRITYWDPAYETPEWQEVDWMGGPWSNRALAREVLKALREEERFHYDHEVMDLVEVEPEALFRLERRPSQVGWEVTA